MALISKMFAIYVFLSLVLASYENETIAYPDWEMIGDYPEYRKYGINTNECGMRYLPTVHNYYYDDDTCYSNKYRRKSLYDIEGNNVMFDYFYANSRVLKGTRVDFGEASFTVFIFGWKWDNVWSSLFSFKRNFWRMGRKYGVCTGSLITTEWVLTAAHCGMPKDYRVSIFAGSNFRGKGEERGIGKWFPNPGFADYNYRDKYKLRIPYEELSEEFKFFDIALIKLDKPISRRRRGRRYIINTICLPKRNHTFYEKKSATFFGYGMEYFSWWFSLGSDVMMKGNAKLSDCYMRYCANYSASDYTSPRTCPGDSGGPLVQYPNDWWTRAVQIGVLRGMAPGPVTGEFFLCKQEHLLKGFWTSIPLHIDWILETIANN